MRLDEVTISVMVNRTWMLPVFNQLRSTSPKEENQDEWDRIRKLISGVWNQPVEKILEVILFVFTTIAPSHDNTDEWAGLRIGCKSLLESLYQGGDVDDIAIRFFSLLKGFKPKNSNVDEWNAIRKDG